MGHKPVGNTTTRSTSTSSAATGALAHKTGSLRVACVGADSFVAIGTEPTATTNDFAIPSGTVGTLAFSNTSAKVASISTSTTYTIIDFPQGTSSPFGVGDYVSLDLAAGSSQDYYNFTHKRVYAVYDGGNTADAYAGKNYFGNRIIVENDYGRNISTSLIDNNTSLRASLKVAAITDSGSGKAYIQQVQISGDA